MSLSSSWLINQNSLTNNKHLGQTEGWHCDWGSILDALWLEARSNPGLQKSIFSVWQGSHDHIMTMMLLRMTMMLMRMPMILIKMTMILKLLSTKIMGDAFMLICTRCSSSCQGMPRGFSLFIISPPQNLLDMWQQSEFTRTNQNQDSWECLWSLPPQGSVEQRQTSV